MSRLFERHIAVTVVPQGRAGVRITGLRIEFEVEKTSGDTPNRLMLKLHNLSDETASSISQRDFTLLLEAGYQSNGELLYAGDILTVVDAWEETDRVTTLECGDGAKALRSATLFESFAGGTSPKVVFERLAGALGVPLGEVKGLDQGQYVSGFVASGPTRGTLDTLARRLKVRWSVQDGVLQVLPVGDHTRDEAILLTADTGLINTPERTDQGIRVMSLLNPKLNPGRRIRVESRSLTGDFVVETVLHQGDSLGDLWQSEVEAREVRR